jgi:hypothetical protein
LWATDLTFSDLLGATREQELTLVDLSGEDDDDMHINLSRDKDVINLTADNLG